MMSRKLFDNEVAGIKDEIKKTAEFVSTEIERAVDAVENWDTELAKEIIERDEFADSEFIKGQEVCAKLIAKYQPLSTDLRFIEAVISVLANLERTADYAVDIARVLTYYKEKQFITKESIGIMREMQKKGCEALVKAVDAFVEENIEKTKEVHELERKSDELYAHMFAVLEERIKKKPEASYTAFSEILIARALERVGDRAVNIANRTAYLITGDAKYLR
ncbi:MAG: phosphate signaling complex protein PhoU [Candidatus Micrarchaeia archaeon]